MSHTTRRRSQRALTALLLALCACGTDPAPSPGLADTPELPPDAAPDLPEDLPEDTATPDLPPDAPDIEAPKGLCEPCTVDEECGGAFDRCLQLPGEPSPTCATDCSADPEGCPGGFSCLTVQELPLIQLCVPASLTCQERCDGVSCAAGEVCDPRTGECAQAQGLCDLDCALDALCGGPDDRCVALPDTGESICARACGDDLPCPDGYFCAEVGQDTGNFQCVPQILTCVDRCAGVSCPNAEVCDPQTGACEAPLGLCDTGCVNSALCGTRPEDICINLGTPDDEVICATACEDSRECPLNYFCAQLEGRALGVCIPLELTCVTDRCDGQDCGPDANCDPRTGACVRREVGLCERCGDLPNAACGGPDDLCLGLGDGGDTICTQDCTADGACPNDGYACVILNNTTRRACVPIGNDCARCDGVDCPDGATCNPLTGACEAPLASCLEVPCPTDALCNPDTGLCERINAPCAWETRGEDCFGSVRRCTATRPGATGVCAAICEEDQDCSAGSPRCVELSRVGALCVPEGLGGPTSCGVLSEEGVDIGRRCGAGVTTPCPDGAPLCVEGVEADIPGFCARPCERDLDCGGDGTCQPVRGRQGRLCVPNNCLCLTGAAVPEGDDLLARALDAHALTRCSFGIDPTALGALGDAIPRAPLQRPGISGLLAQPLSTVGQADALQQELAAALQGPRPLRDALIAAAARQGAALQARQPQWPLQGDLSPLREGLRRFAQAAGDTWDPARLQGDPDAADLPLQEALAKLLFAAAAVVEARHGVTDALGLDPERLQALYDQLPWLLLTPPEGAAAPDLADPDTLALLDALDLTPLYQATADLLATLEELRPLLAQAPEALSLRLPTAAGWIILGAHGDTTWDPALDPTLDEPLALVIDFSGDDTWLAPAGATRRAAQPLALLLDLGGADTYTYTARPDPRDQPAWLPSDADGRLAPTRPVQATDGPVSRSATPRQGAAILGVGLLIDLGDGDDTYRSLRISQGAAVLGLGALLDEGGADQYEVEAFGQGAALLGLGLLLDLGGDDDQDTYRAWFASQGFGAARGLGLLLDALGPSRYTAEPATGLSDVLYYAPADRGLSNGNLSQGVGAGLAPPDDRQPDRQTLGGGLGALLDLHGDDTYAAGTLAQGAGLLLGHGLLLDADGQDTYRARGSAQGFGQRAGLGALLDHNGHDAYNLDTDRPLAALAGHGDDLGAGLLLDRQGDDQYLLPRASGGAGQLNGLGALLDLQGDDQHRANNDASWGHAALGPDAADPQDPRRLLPTLGLFLDANGLDAYSRPDVDRDNPLLIQNDQRWTLPAPAPERGVGLDGDGLTGLE
jgi:hypothetical protein